MFPFDTISFIIGLILLAKIIRLTKKPYGQIEEPIEYSPPEY
jgi:hypothetical protein